MSILRWRPYGDLIGLNERINSLFEDEFYKKREDSKTSMDNCWTPSADIYEEADSYLFRFEIPGIKKEDVSVDINDNVLTVKGEKKLNREINKDNYYRTESCFGSFTRSFTLPKEIKEDGISAELKDGVLELSIPKAEEKIAKSIPINIS